MAIIMCYYCYCMWQLLAQCRGILTDPSRHVEVYVGKDLNSSPKQHSTPHGTDRGIQKKPNCYAKDRTVDGNETPTPFPT